MESRSKIGVAGAFTLGPASRKTPEYTIFQQRIIENKTNRVFYCIKCIKKQYLFSLASITNIHVAYSILLRKEPQELRPGPGFSLHDPDGTQF